MQSNLKYIKERRRDITDWVIHWTHRNEKKSPWDVLKQILKSGYLKPSFAVRNFKTPEGRWEERKAVHGAYPAVCFSEQPIASFLDSYLADGLRYGGCGIAFEKRHLFQYGGRPVIYGDTNLLKRLNDVDKYLWVAYSPLPQPHREYPIDWTHEREWRTRLHCHNIPDWGPTPEEGVPLVLPPIDINGTSTISFPKILVINSGIADNVREFIRSILGDDCTNRYIKHLHTCLPKLEIITLEMIQEKLENRADKWTRLDTLPCDEIPEQ